MMARWMLLVMLGLCFFHGSRVDAHDLGFRVFTFEELQDGRYQLKYIARPDGVESQEPPRLSEGLTWEQDPGLPEGLMRLVFNVDGRSLSNDDQIFLPWKTGGIIVEAFWLNGEKVRKIVSHDGEKGGFEIRIGDLRSGEGAMSEAVARFTGMGMRHLVTGMGHLLCLLVILMLPGRKWAPTCVAFSAGLALAATVVWAIGWMPPASMADGMAAITLILASGILVRSLRGKSIHFSLGATALFGAVHGVGFAGALADLGLPRAELAVNGGLFILGGIAGVFVIGAVWMCAVKARKTISLEVPGKLAGVAAYALGITATLWSFRELGRWFS